MKRIMDKKDVAEELYYRMKPFKRWMKHKDCEEGFRHRLLKRECLWVLDIIEEIVLENMYEALYDERSSIEIVKGLIIGGNRVPERQCVDPRDGKNIIVKERIIPYARFTRGFKDRVHVESTEDDECTND